MPPVGSARPRALVARGWPFDVTAPAGRLASRWRSGFGPLLAASLAAVGSVPSLPWLAAALARVRAICPPACSGGPPAPLSLVYLPVLSAPPRSVLAFYALPWLFFIFTAPPSLSAPACNLPPLLLSAHSPGSFAEPAQRLLGFYRRMSHGESAPRSGFLLARRSAVAISFDLRGPVLGGTGPRSSAQCCLTVSNPNLIPPT